MRAILIPVLLAALGVAACDDKKEQPQGHGGPPPPVPVAKPVVKQIVEVDDFSGRFEAIGAVEIRARVAGYLESANFAEGGTVKQGDLLFVIDRRPYQAEVNQRAAAVAAARARAELARLELERAEQLQRSGSGTQRSLDERRAGSLTAQTDIQAAEAALAESRLNLNFTEIRAPISGRISRKLVTEGNLVAANSTLLTTIVQTDPIYFYFDVDERYFLAAQRRGQNGAKVAAKIALSDERDPTRDARIDFTDNRLDEATGTMRLRAVLPNDNGLFVPGMFGRIRIPGSEPYNAVLIPDEAIVADLARRYVNVVGPDGKHSQVTVRPGPKHDGYRIVRTGLKGDELVVVGALTQLRFLPVVTPQIRELPPVRVPNGAAPPAAATQGEAR